MERRSQSRLRRPRPSASSERREHVPGSAPDPGAAQAGGEPWRISRGSRRLLCCLLDRDGRPAEASRLATLLWPDDNSSRGSDRVRTEIRRLRAALSGMPGGAAAIVHGPGGYLLNPAVPVDARQFRLLLEEGDRRRAAGDPDAAARRYGEAARLYRGPYLDGEELDDSMYATQAWMEGRLGDVREWNRSRRWPAAARK